MTTGTTELINGYSDRLPAAVYHVLLCTPASQLDVARTRIMVSDGADLSRNPLQVAGAILREEGTMPLFLVTLPKRCSGVHTVNDMT